MKAFQKLWNTLHRKTCPPNKAAHRRMHTSEPLVSQQFTGRLVTFQTKLKPYITILRLSTGGGGGGGGGGNSYYQHLHARMEENAIKVIILCTVVLIVKSGLQPSQRINDKSPEAAALFVFGDSLADVGTNNYINTTVSAARADFPPYGQTFFNTPTGRFSDGRILFDFIAARLGVPPPHPFLQPGVDFSQGVNFASAGSGLLDTTFEQLNVISFGGQVKQCRDVSAVLENRYGYQAELFLADSIFAINVGGNDIAGNYLSNGDLQKSIGPSEFINSLLKVYKEYLMSLHEIGARKFIIFGIAPLGCSPGMRLSGFSTWKGECHDTLNKWFMEFNSGLQKLVSDLNQDLNGAVLLYANNYDFLLNIIRNGKAAGFLETVSACCGGGPFNAGVRCGQEIAPKEKQSHGDGHYSGSVCKDPGQYVYWDGFHPTERVQWMIAEEVWNGDSSFISPFNLSTLIHATGAQNPSHPIHAEPLLSSN